MVLISKRDLLFIGFVSVITILLLGFLGFRIFLHTGMSEEFGSKLRAEQFLFISVLVSTLLLVLYGAALRKSRNVSREIERMTRLTGSDDYRPEVSLKKLGSFGTQLAGLYTRISEMNRKLSIHIGGQSTLIGFLLGNMNQPVLVTDIVGKILYVSKGFVEKRSAIRSELLKQYVESLSPDIVTQTILSGVSGGHGPVTIHLEKEKEDVTIHPVFNRDAMVAYLVFDFSKENFFSREALLPEKKAKAGGENEKGRRRREPLFGGIAALFRRGKR